MVFKLKVCQYHTNFSSSSHIVKVKKYEILQNNLLVSFLKQKKSNLSEHSSHENDIKKNNRELLIHNKDSNPHTQKNFKTNFCAAVKVV